MKKIILSIAAVSVLWFFQPASPVLAGSSSHWSLSMNTHIFGQPIMLQNIMRLFQFLNHSKSGSRETLPAEKTEDIQAGTELRKRSSRSFSRESTNLDRSDFSPREDTSQSVQNPIALDFSQQEPAIQPPVEAPSPEPTPQAVPVPEPTADPSINKVNSILEEAKKYRGLRYVWGGTSPSGFDCSGFVYYLYEKNGVDLPRVSFSQFKTGDKVSRNQLVAGDLVFFNTDGTGASHVGIYMGGENFIHSSSGAKKVTISSLNDSFYASRFLGARRVLK